jgi:hypothetical protein
MSLDKPSPDIPGTTVFDAGQSRKGYQLRDLKGEAGVGERMLRTGLVHGGFELLYTGKRPRIDLNRSYR